MEKHTRDPVSVSPPRHRRVDPAVEERRRVMVALLRQHPEGLTAREIGQATGIPRNLTASALSGLFTRGVLHKQGHRYVLAAHEKALHRSSEG
jgi:DNA-binding IclR family transcriptional regulator